MSERKYTIYDAGFNIIADSMSLDDALIFIEAYYNKYYSDNDITLIIKAKAKCEDVRSGSDGNKSNS